MFSLACRNHIMKLIVEKVNNFSNASSSLNILYSKDLKGKRCTKIDKTKFESGITDAYVYIMEIILKC